MGHSGAQLVTTRRKMSVEAAAKEGGTRQVRLRLPGAVVEAMEEIAAERLLETGDVGREAIAEFLKARGKFPGAKAPAAAN